MDKQQQLIVLGNRRDFLTVTGCANPDVWDALGDEYRVIGAESSAAACYRRADGYRVREADTAADPYKFVAMGAG